MKKFYETVSLNDISNKARRFFEESDGRVLDDIFGDCTTVESINSTADELFGHFFYWYAVQSSSDDSWDNGSFDRDEAIEMLREQGHGLIAVIDDISDNPVCMDEIRYDDVF